MKNRKGIFFSILAGMLSCTYCMTASADSYVNGGILKNGLLTVDTVNLSEYNTNDDNVINVIDLVRVKNRILKSNIAEKQYVTFECEGPWMSADKSKLTVPVIVKGNKTGISATSFKVEYDNWYFELVDVYPSSDGQTAFSKENDVVQYTSPDGENMRSEGYLLYLEFSVSPMVPEDKYDIEITDVQCAMKGSDGKSVSLKSDEYKNGTLLSFDFFREKVTEPPVTVPVPEETTVVTTTTAATTTTVTEPKTPEPPKSDKLNFSLDNAEVVSDGRQLKIPVYMDVNERGLNSLNMNVKYDQNKFSLTGVEFNGFDGYGYIAGNKDNAVLTMNNGQNISQRSGIMAYLKFDINGGTDSKTYDFELRDIKAYYSENWNQKPIDKLENKSKVYKYSLSGENITTEPPVETISPFDTTTVTTTITTVVQEPVTTTVMTTAQIPVTTAAPSSGYKLSDEQMWFIDQANTYRTSNGKPQLKIFEKAFKAADERAKMLKESFKEDLPDGRNFKWVLYDNDIIPYAISQYIDNTSSTKEDVWKNYIAGSSAYLLNDSMFDRIAFGHFSDESGRNYWVVFTFS